MFAIRNAFENVGNPAARYWPKSGHALVVIDSKNCKKFKTKNAAEKYLKDMVDCGEVKAGHNYVVSV